MSTKSNQLGRQARDVAEDVQSMGETVKDGAQETLEQAADKAAEYYEQGRDTVHGAACACEQFLRERPLMSILIAAGVGWLFGRFWKHR